MVQYPSVWEQVESQTENLQLYNVDPMSSEVAALVAEVEAHSNCKVLKVGYGNLDSMSCNPACDMHEHRPLTPTPPILLHADSKRTLLNIMPANYSTIPSAASS